MSAGFWIELQKKRNFKERGQTMERKEMIDAIEQYGQYLIEFAKNERNAPEKKDERDLKALIEKSLKPVFSMKFDSPYLEALRDTAEWNQIMRTANAIKIARE